MSSVTLGISVPVIKWAGELGKQMNGMILRLAHICVNCPVSIGFGMNPPCI